MEKLKMAFLNIKMKLMAGNNPTWLSFLMLLLISVSCPTAKSQPVLFDLEDWYEKLSSPENAGYTSTIDLLQLVHTQDSVSIFSMLSQLESRIPKANMYYKARVSCSRALAKFNYRNYHAISEMTAISEKAINEAYATNDKRFIAFITWLCGSLMINMQQLELAVTYKMRAEDIYSEIGYLDYNYIKNWGLIGELLFHSRDFEQSVLYTRKALDSWSEKTALADYTRIRYYNTIAQDYEQLNKLDSALIYLDTSLALSQKGPYKEWMGINSGFKGEVLFKMQKYQKAKPFLEYDYITNRDEYVDIAAKSLQWLARINLLEGKNDSALMKSKEAVQLIQKIKFRYYLQPARYLEMTYSALAESFKATGHLDSFYYYTRLHSQLHDSIQNVAFQSSSRIIRMKIDNQNTLNAIQSLEKEKRNEVTRRNLIIAAIALLSVIVFLYIKQSQLKQRHREEMVLQEKRLAETELASAKQQMQQFTENIIEKSNLIEKLQHQITGKEINGEHQQTIKDLTSLTILTEADWENFKRMFERLYPPFFTLLKEKAPNITVAEQRMAALTRLNLNSKQMASMLGISVDSVHKTKQRLRQRLHVQNEASLEETLSYL
jgi:DNA-binding CsgD family transcriptional regulator